MRILMYFNMKFIINEMVLCFICDVVIWYVLYYPYFMISYEFTYMHKRTTETTICRGNSKRHTAIYSPPFYSMTEDA